MSCIYVGACVVRELDGQLTERVATLFNKLQFLVSKSRGLPLIDDVKPVRACCPSRVVVIKLCISCASLLQRIAQITTRLQLSLETSFGEGLRTSDVSTLRQCLRTYATIDKTRDAENLFRQLSVKPYMQETVNDQVLADVGLSGMFARVLDFIPQHCDILRSVLSGQSSHSDVIRGYDFVVNAVWPEFVANVEARTPSIFAPGNPNLFHEVRFLKRPQCHVCLQIYPFCSDTPRAWSSWASSSGRAGLWRACVASVPTPATTRSSPSGVCPCTSKFASRRSQARSRLSSEVDPSSWLQVRPFTTQLSYSLIHG